MDDGRSMMLQDYEHLLKINPPRKTGAVTRLNARSPSGPWFRSTDDEARISLRTHIIDAHLCSEEN